MIASLEQAFLAVVVWRGRSALIVRRLGKVRGHEGGSRHDRLEVLLERRPEREGCLEHRSREIPLSKGETFPPCSAGGRHGTTWELVRRA